MRDILIRGGLVVASGSEGAEHSVRDILVRDGKIAAIEPELPAEEREVVDAHAMIVAPGLVDTHRHVWQTQLRGVAGDWSLFDYVIQMRGVYSSFYTPEDVELANYAGALEAIDAGITTIVDHSHVINSPAHADAAIDGLCKAGIRSIFCYGLFANPEQHPFRRTFTPAWRLDDARRIRRERLSDDEGRVLFGLAPSELEARSIEDNIAEIRFGRELGAASISCHVAMGPYDRGNRFVARLGEAGLLGRDMLFVHGAALLDEELRLIAEAGAGISSTPETELQMGMGHPVGFRAARFGIAVGLGVDIVSNFAGDMFTQMRLMLQSSRAQDNAERHTRTGLAPKNIRPTAREVLHMATIGGARAANLGDRVGSIEVGKRADIILVDTAKLHMTPCADPVQALTLFANAADVHTVLVDGIIRKRFGKLLDVDLAGLLNRLSRSRTRLDEHFAQVDLSEVEAAILPHYTNLEVTA